MKNHIILCILTFILTVSINAQDSIIKKRNFEKPEVQGFQIGTLSEQFEFLLQNSDAYKNYHVIKDDWFIKLQSQVNDSVSILKTQLTITSQQNLTLSNEVNALKSEILFNEEQLNEKDTISFLGIPLAKSTYNTIMWGILLISLGSMFYFLRKYKSSNDITNETLQQFKELEAEFNLSRSKALEREQLLNRKIMDLESKKKK